MMQTEVYVVSLCRGKKTRQKVKAQTLGLKERAKAEKDSPPPPNQQYLFPFLC